MPNFTKAGAALVPADISAIKITLSLDQVDNTPDSAKPVSTAQAQALTLKAPLTNPAFTGTPTGITKAHVGLANVDNTSDVNKPVSNAQAAAILAVSTSFANLAALNAAINSGKLASTPSGQRITLATTPTGVERIWNSVDANTILIRPGLIRTLLSSNNQVYSTTGAPTSGSSFWASSINGDEAVDYTNNTYYAKSANVWTVVPSIYPTVLTAAQATAAANLVAGSRKIAFGILGQSNEVGQVLNSDEAAYPQCFQSLRQPGLCMPLAGNNISTNAGLRRGGWWLKFFDDLWDWGYEAQIFNGAVGSASMLKHFAGQVATRANSTAYGMRRNSQGDGVDMGYTGDLIVQSGKLFLCTTGRRNYSMRRMPNLAEQLTGVGSPYDYIATIGSQASGASDPGLWAASSLLSTVTDGTVTWTNIDDTNSVGYSSGKILDEGSMGLGFDPYGILARLHQNMQAIQGVASRHIIICQGQGDIGTAASSYGSAMTNVARYFLRRGYYVWFGLSCFAPTTSSANYDNLTAGVATALANCQGDAAWGSRALAGANLYTLMGSTGPMASGGAYLQGDNVHLTGAASLIAGGYWSDRVKAVLPKLS